MSSSLRAGTSAAPVAAGALRPVPAREPYYLASGDEVRVFEACHARRLPVMLKGPTGCGKTRFVEHMAYRLGRPLVTVACHDDLTASDLVGRYLVRGGETIWQDGPLALAVRAGALCYLDEVVEARQDTVVVLHPLADDRRILPIDKTGELLEAAPGFTLVVSFNPGYQHALKELKPSTRQRFVALELGLPPAEHEAAIVEHEAGVDAPTAKLLVTIGARLRRLRDRGLAEVPSTRLLVSTGRLIASGIPVADACRSALIGPLSDDPDLLVGMEDIVRSLS
jgi:nitric oxide reductase NorQ protein